MMKLLAIFVGLITAFWLLISLVALPIFAISVADNPTLPTPAQVGLDYEDIVVESKGIDLAGWWLPAQGQPKATALFVHGAGSNRASNFVDTLGLFKALTERGVAVITVDLRNHGNSPRTDGRLGMGKTEWPDVVAMSHWLDQKQVAGLPRLLVGASMGGATVIHAMANGLNATGVILIDPALNTADTFAQGGWIKTGLPAGVFRLYAWATTYWFDLPRGEHDTLALASNLQIKPEQPFVLIQDPQDPITRLPYARQVANNNQAITLRIAPEIPASASCISGKGRWGTHVAAFACHRPWFLTQLDAVLTTIVPRPRQQF